MGGSPRDPVADDKSPGKADAWRPLGLLLPLLPRKRDGQYEIPRCCISQLWCSKRCSALLARMASVFIHKQATRPQRARTKRIFKMLLSASAVSSHLVVMSTLMNRGKKAVQCVQFDRRVAVKVSIEAMPCPSFTRTERQ